MKTPVRLLLRCLAGIPNLKRVVAGIATALSLSVIGLPAQAVFIGNTQGGVDFPQGAISFADSLVSYALTASVPGSAFQGATNAVGLPNYAGNNGCASQAACTFVSLGSGGVLTLQFIDNRLTGSGTNALDLWVFEVGPNVEDTFVDISKDGVAWSAVGKVFGSTAGIDIDAFGFGVGDQFAFVRLTDDPNEGGGGSGGSVGADIDSVGAITTVPANRVPEPQSLGLLLLGLAGMVATRRASARRRPASSG